MRFDRSKQGKIAAFYKYLSTRSAELAKLDAQMLLMFPVRLHLTKQSCVIYDPAPRPWCLAVLVSQQLPQLGVKGGWAVDGKTTGDRCYPSKRCNAKGNGLPGGKDSTNPPTSPGATQPEHAACINCD